MKKIIVVLLCVLCCFGAIAQAGLPEGATAPLFSVKDNSGKVVDLGALLKSHKAVVLFFYRGQWCPYCNKQIMHLQDSLQLLTAKGAYVVGVTPETDDNIGKTIQKTHASFSMIHDDRYKIMKAYDVNYTLDTGMVRKYKNYGVDLVANNGNTDEVLPVPATYVIDHTGKIIFVHFDKDYRNRPSVYSLLQVLK